MLKEFRDFINRGNVIDLAVAVIIGAAFKTVVDAFANEIIGGLIAAIGGKPNLDELTLTVGDGLIRYGVVLTALINFVIVAWAVFLLVKAINRAQNLRKKQEEAAAEPTELELLTQIRDALVAQRP